MKKALGIALIVLLSAGSVALAHGKGVGHGSAMLEKLDKNADGKITKDEAAAGAKEPFAELDQNRDGKLTKDELAARFEKHMQERDEARQEQRAERAEKFREHGEKRFAQADTNQDGVLDAKEFAVGLAKHFDRLDDDGNGVVEEDELPRGRHHGRGHGARHGGEGCDHDEHEGSRGERERG